MAVKKDRNADWNKGYAQGLKEAKKGFLFSKGGDNAKTNGRLTGRSVAKSVAAGKAGGETKRENKRTSVMKKADLNKKKK